MLRRAAGLAALRARIRAIELDGGDAPGTLVPFGVAAIDDVLPGGGLVRGALHEIAAETVIGGAATAFAAALAAHLATPARPLVPSVPNQTVPSASARIASTPMPPRPSAVV